MKDNIKFIHYLHEELQDNREYESIGYKNNQIGIIQKPHDVRDRLPLLLITIEEVTQ